MLDLYEELSKLVAALDEEKIDYALCVRQIDMSAKAVTARLKLASQLRRLCLSLGTAKVEPRPLKKEKVVEKAQNSRRSVK